MSQDDGGLWHSPYMKVYAAGGKMRFIEVSNYPRAYKDTEEHVYLFNTIFTVIERDLNEFLEDGTEVYRDIQEQNFKVGEQATHFVGEPLPGSFPLWLESETLPDEPNEGFHINDLSTIILSTVKTIELQQNGAFQDLPTDVLKAFIKKGHNQHFRLPHAISRGNKQVLRFYVRVK